jgi:two-component system NtrC family sensor kinase
MQSKVSSKLIAAVGIVAIAIIGIFAYLILSAHQRQLIAELERNAHQLSETVKSSTKYDMLLNQRESVHRIIQTIGKQEGIEKVRIFNKEGAIIFSTDPLDIGKMVDKQAEACYVCHAADQPLERLSIAQTTRIFAAQPQVRTLGVINPIYNEPGCWQSACHAHTQNQKVLGVLDITMSLAAVDHSMRASQMRLLVFAVIAITAISLIIYLLVKSLVLKPVRQIVAATHHVAQGDLNYTIGLDKNDEIGELAKSFNEMTRQLSETQRQLYQSEKLASIGRLAAGVAHEINNPLTGVLTYSSFLLKRADPQAENKEDLEVIVRETKRCREIVKGLLDFGRQSPPEKRQVSINDVINHAVRIVQNQFAIQHIQLSTDLDPRLPSTQADVNQIQQVLINLLMNASDAIGEKGGTVTVTTGVADRTAGGADDGTLDRDYIRIRVSDDGCGIPAVNLSKVFEPFFSTKGQKGTGLGLAVVWGIIEKHNGRITVESTVGKGTAFTILLPVDTGK